MMFDYVSLIYDFPTRNDQEQPPMSTYVCQLLYYISGCAEEKKRKVLFTETWNDDYPNEIFFLRNMMLGQ